MGALGAGPCFERDVESLDTPRFPTAGGPLPPAGPEDLGQIGHRTMQSPVSPDRLQAPCEELTTPLRGFQITDDGFHGDLPPPVPAAPGFRMQIPSHAIFRHLFRTWAIGDSTF